MNSDPKLAVAGKINRNQIEHEVAVLATTARTPVNERNLVHGNLCLVRRKKSRVEPIPVDKLEINVQIKVGGIQGKEDMVKTMEAM